MAENKWQGQNPWMGLAPYTEGITLYGRSEECTVLSEIIKNNIVSVVFGKSGIGKSSLLSAGISPMLRNENYIPIRIRLVHNTDTSYVEQIKKTVKEVVKCEDQLHASLPEFGLWDFFHRNVFHTTEGDECVPVIILDQFEEIYTLTDGEHKACIIDFFSELSYLLNDIKPDLVAEYEQAIDRTFIEEKEQHTGKKGLVLKRSKRNPIKFLPSKDYRLVICLREDKLYLLERNSSNIPSLKNNRYNLRALSPQSAIEVIMCPRPNLFSNDEAIAIVDKIADVGEEGIRTIDPAILSLFLFKYFEKKGASNYDNIFAEYYRESTKDVKVKSIAFLENHLLTLGGYRNQIPLDDALSSGVSHTDIQKLLGKVILRTEKRKDLDYIEFSHDRLCEEAKRSRDERNIAIQKKVTRKRMMFGGGIIMLLIIIVLLFAFQNSELKNKENDLQTNLRVIKQINDSLDNLVAEKNMMNKTLASEMAISKMKSDSLLYLLGVIKYSNKLIRERNDSLRDLNSELSIYKEFDKRRSSIDSITASMVSEGYGKRISKKVVFDSSVIDGDLCSWEEQLTIQEQSGINNSTWSVAELTNKFYSICLMLSESSVFPTQAVNEIRGKYSDFSSLRQISDETPSYKGHLIFDYDFLSDLEKHGSTVYDNADKYIKGSGRGQVPQNSILVKTCFVRGNSCGIFKFITRGETNLAIVAEPNGLVSVKIHVTNSGGYDVWYGDSGDKIIGKPFKYLYFQTPDSIRSTVTLEVRNHITHDITFAVISN